MKSKIKFLQNKDFSLILIITRTDLVRYKRPPLSYIVVVSLKEWGGGDNLGGRDKKCHLFRRTLEPIFRADQPLSPWHLQRRADND